MIEITTKVDCCGCSACQSICPQKCISMESDCEGFLYPQIDTSLCTNCNSCERVCPINAKRNSRKIKDITPIGKKEEITKIAINQCRYLPDTYVTYIKNSALRHDSTSGGFFTAVAQEILLRKGKVYGVEVDKNKRIIHSSVEAFEELWRFRGSKYVQSEQFGIYEYIKNDLQKDRWVLYSGTPCQVEGLKNFLGKEYDKLVTVDIFCHGVGSPKYWNKYVSFMEQKYKSKIKKVKFREKTYGYNSACMAVYFENGKSSHKGHDDDLYWTAFSKFYIFRPSCYKCEFKTVNHVADFSIGDFWDVGDLNVKFRNSNGCSLLLVHTDKGKKLLEEIENQIEKTPIEIEKALMINGGPMPSKLITSSPLIKNRDEFFVEMDKYSIDRLVKKYLPLSFKSKVRCLLKPFLYRIGVLAAFKRIMK